jgi:CRISPR-associated endonuclease/helicase Cas3
MPDQTGTTTAVDLVFRINGQAIPRDHGYALYGAISRIVPSIHRATGIGIFPIRGTPPGDNTLLITERSCLRIRVAAERLPMLLALAGQALELDGHRLRLGVPRVAALIPAPTLASPLVLIKLAHAQGHDCITPEAFLASARRKLQDLDIQGEPGIQLARAGARAGQPRRRVIRVKDQTHVGYAMLVQGLTADESLRLQHEGLGGRRLMGCGLFLPARGAP